MRSVYLYEDANTLLADRFAASQYVLGSTLSGEPGIGEEQPVSQ